MFDIKLKKEEEMILKINSCTKLPRDLYARVSDLTWRLARDELEGQRRAVCSQPSSHTWFQPKVVKQTRLN